MPCSPPRAIPIRFLSQIIIPLLSHLLWLAPGPAPTATLPFKFLDRALAGRLVLSGLEAPPR